MAIDLPQVITAVGGLGTAAFGLVDTTKVFGGGVNHAGFSGIRSTVTRLTPGAESQGANSMSRVRILATLKANWFSGTKLDDQKAIAKSLIKLNLNPSNAGALAQELGIDPNDLRIVAESMRKTEALGETHSDVLARFDFILTATLDETYQHADQVYRNTARALATVIAVGLAVVGGRIVGVGDGTAVLVGLLATPLAPIAKDLSSALVAAVNAMQGVKK